MTTAVSGGKLTTYKTIDQEIKETLQTIKNDPRNSTFYYIHAAKLYSCQGQQQEAISILNQGITMVTQHDKDALLLLKQQLAIVTERSERYIDFISQSPYEIVFTIIYYLVDDQESRFTCLDVCRAWRSKFLDHATKLWPSLDLHGTPPRKNLLKVLPIISKYVKNLRMYPGARGVEYNHHSYVTDALSIIGKQLTELDICVGKATNISLQQVLFQCPRLLSIKLNVHSSIGNRFMPITGAFTSLLTRIELIARRELIPISEIEPLFDYTPHLRHLILYKFSSQTNFLTVLGNRCPELAEIRVAGREYNSTEEQLHRRSRPPITSKSNETKQGGLQCLELHIFYVTSIIPFADRWKKSRHSLKKVSLFPSAVYGITPTLEDWQPLSSCTMYNLSVFSILNPCESFFKHLPSILLCFPALESLYLNFPMRPRRFSKLVYDKSDATTFDSMFDVIAQLKKLTKLHISYAYLGSQGFKQFLSKMMMQEYTNTVQNNTSSGGGGLRNLKITRCEGFDISLLSDIAMIHSLESLSLIDFFDSWVGEPVDDALIKDFQEALITVVTSLPKLSKLDLNLVPLMFNTVEVMMNCQYLDYLFLGRSISYHECKRDDVRIFYINIIGVVNCIKFMRVYKPPQQHYISLLEILRMLQYDT
ncbi:hypothetical protein BDA99DRAFT_568915 [Phascolomyces articulosus]|uniref:F-box domain-containing protein n=1 Tax=Phascolomyces articulosus TaxID=60185 RepID=A0AAD5PK54_9FUNG|nr:hypothetical protein BDA99DRAFT_568915 [Phascolomyces articulosus]